MKKTVLITGASSGIGKATAELFAQRGWNVAATMRDPARGGDLAKRDDVLVTRLDVQDRASIEAAVAATVARFGGVDALVNNAGYGQYGLFEAVPREKVVEQFEVNVFGAMDAIRAVLPHMRARRSGTIVNLSSGAGIFTLPMISLYCASKFALEGFSESLSYELAALGIAVKLVQPHGGVTGTRFNARAGEGDAADPAPADYEAFAARTAAAYAAMSAARSIGAGDVAAVVHQAVTDGSDRLRYLVGNDTRGFVKARQTLPDQAYVDFMRAWFRER